MSSTTILNCFKVIAFLAAVGSVTSTSAARQIRPIPGGDPGLRGRGGFNPSIVVLHSFGTTPVGDGANPVASLVVDGNGTLYGTAQGGGNGNGVVFSFTPIGAVGNYTERVLYAFKGGADGAHPIGGVVVDNSGALYGTTSSGGSAGVGVVFKLSPPSGGQPNWAETVLHSFGTSPGSSDGATPVASLLWMNGALYGTTENGGTAGYGVVFKVAPVGTSWVESVLHSFATSPGASDGANPTAGLIADKLGDLYGTTQGGGIGSGVAFALVPAAGSSWNETVLHTFGTAPRAADGAHPAGSLVFGIGNALYGTTISGGSSNEGVTFRLAFGGSAWTETVLHTFGTTAGSADGSNPTSGLASDASGNLYGTTFDGGTGYGVVYELSVPQNGQPWTQSVISEFETGNDNGANPKAGLVLSNGEFFGATEGGGKSYGTFFMLCVKPGGLC